MEKSKVEYILTTKDLQAFDRYLWKGRRWVFWFLPAAVVGFPAILMISSNVKLLENPELLGEALKSLGGQMIFPAVIIFLFWLFFVRQNYASLEKNSPELFEKRVTEVTEDYLMNSDSQGETRTFWSAVKSIAQDERHIYIMLQQKEQGGFVIPKRAFQNSNDASLFFQTGHQHWKSREGNPW